MNLLLVKIGKAIKTIRRNGLINGGRRVCKGGIAMMQIVHPGDILIITGGIGDSALYRAYHQAEDEEEPLVGHDRVPAETQGIGGDHAVECGCVWFHNFPGRQQGPAIIK